MAADAAAPGRGGCLLLLDVPPGSSITLDGVTRVTPAQPATGGASSPLPRGLCIITHIQSASNDGFHFLVVRPGSSNNPGTYPELSKGCRTLPVGFMLAPPDGAPSSDNVGYEWIFARRYDPRTEEMSNQPVDELTVNNLVAAINEGGELQNFCMSYDQFMKSEKSDKSLIPNWEARTSLINARYLQNRHGISSGDKVVPSSESANAGESATANDPVEGNNSDGASVSYPPIPCIDPTINARKLAQHMGTRVYLSKVSPQKRTQLLSGGFGADAETINPGEHVWKDVLGSEYGDKVDDFLADIELSFLLTLFMECHASLEHWRDSVSMCSLSAGAGSTNVSQHPQFFQKLLDMLTHQLASIDGEFFQDVEYSAGEDNFLIGALRRLCAACENVGKRKRDGDDVADRLKSSSQKLRELVRGRFGLDVFLPESSEDNDGEIDAVAMDVGDDGGGRCKNDALDAYKNQADDDDSDEEDCPVIVPYDEVEESVARSSVQRGKVATETPEQARHREHYPLLYAAMTADEDEVMACARILGDKRDVSLVREAAAYLEEVEAHRGGSMF